MKKKATPEELSFEQAMIRLEEIVRELDRGDLALEQALELFQEGNALREVCERKLADAEASVEELLAPAVETSPSHGVSLEPGLPADSLFGDDDE